MFDENKNIRLLDLRVPHNGIAYIMLININILFDIARLKYAWWRGLFSAAILLAGLSGPLQALPENTKSGDIEYSLNLNFSATTPITLSNMMVAGRSEINDVHPGTLEYSLSPEVTKTGGKGREPGNRFPSDTRLTRESGNALLSHGESGAVGLGAPNKIALAAVTPSAAVTSAMSAKNEEPASDGQEGHMLSRGEGAIFPYATITLAILALLGLVSVARRNDIG